MDTSDYKFKVGDKVKQNGKGVPYKSKEGFVGVVDSVNYGKDRGDYSVNQVFVAFGPDNLLYYRDYELDLVEETKPMFKPKFKVGDKVRQSYPHSYLFNGKPETVGTVTQVRQDSFDYRVDFSEVAAAYGDWTMSESELELVQSVESVKREALMATSQAPTQTRLIDDYIKTSVQVVEADSVSNPSHYTSGQIECIDYIRSVLSTEEFRGWLRGNVIKYQHRYLLKGKPVEDLKKILFYTKELIALEESF